MDSYIEYLYALGLAERTIVIYRRSVERFITWCVDETINPSAVSALQLSAYAQFIPQTATSRRQHRTALRHWFESIGAPTQRCAAIRVPPKKRGMPRPLEPGEASALTRTALGWSPEGTAVLLGLYLGLRREEIATARWDRFTADGSWYTVLGKGSVEATLPVHPVLREELAGRAMMYPWLFPGRSLAHICPGTVNVWVCKVAVAAGIGDVAPHRLRHTAISTINDATGDLRAAQEFARHADPATTRIYTRVTAQRLKRAVDSLRYVA